MNSTDDRFKGVNDYEKYKRLSENPIQMAIKILELEASFKRYKVQSDPNRRQALLERLKMAVDLSKEDQEQGHSEADDILLELIDDPEVTEIYGQVSRWFA